MAFEGQATNPEIKIVFDGLNTHVNELWIKNFSSPDMKNCDLDPVITIRKRDGILKINEPNGTGKVGMLSLLYRMSEDRGVLYMSRGDLMDAVSAAGPSGSLTEIATPWEDVEMPGTTTATYTAESYSDPDWTYTHMGEVLYCTERDHEPMILTGTIAAKTAGGAFGSLQSEPGTLWIEVQKTSHGFSDGDVVKISGLDDPNWAFMEGRSFFVEVQNVGYFWLRDGNLNRIVGPDVLLEDVGNSITHADQMIRWPMGKYSLTTPVRGYPRVWVDPNDEWTSGDWPDNDIVHDWPTHTHYIGQGLGARMFAYGFALDPDRIDYSALGQPYNFLKEDPLAVDEASAPTAPDTDGGYFYCMKGDGDRVIAVRELMGYIVVFKTQRTVLWTGEIGNWFRIAQEYPVGATNDEAVVKVGNDIYFWSFDGPRRLSPSQTNADLLQGSISAEVIEVAKTLSSSNSGRIIARHERLKQRVVWHFPSDSSTENDKCLVYYYPTSADPDGRWALWDGPYAEMSQHVVFENPSDGTTTEYGGSNTDPYYLYVLNAGSLDGYSESLTVPGTYDVPVPINMLYITKWFDFDTVTVHKRALRLLALYGEDGPGGMLFSVGYDYASAWLDIDRPLSAGGESNSLWSYSVWNNAANDYDTYWNEGGKSMVDFETEGIGRIVRFKIEDTSTLPCALGGLVFGPSRKGTR